MSTYVDGIAASENLDTAGERISIAGLDCSSLDVDGVLNWEHKNDQPSQIVGKILKYKKIFSEQDCEDERHLYFWNKIQTPYLYIMGELMDDYKDSAREVAGMFQYDADKKNQNDHSVMNFSIEGAKIKKEGMDITRSIARKVTITAMPANKAAVAEMVPQKSADNDPNDLNSLFKTETAIEIEILPVDKDTLGLFKKEQSMRKDDLTNVSAGGPNGPSLSANEKNNKTLNKADSATSNPMGTSIGQTRSGKDVFSHGRIHEYQNFGSKDHKEAAQMHEKMASSGDNKAREHHVGKMKLHMQAAESASKKEARGSNPPAHTAPRGIPSSSSIPNYKQSFDHTLSGKIPKPGPIKKSEDDRHTKVSGIYSAPDLNPGEKYHLHSVGSNGAVNYKGVVSSKKSMRSAANARDLKHGSIMTHKVTVIPAPAMKKAMTAGSGMAAPSALTGGSALAKEDLNRTIKKAVGPGRNTGVHVGVIDKRPGQSISGSIVRAANSSDPNFKQGILASAKNIHKEKLKGLKAMPKPNLTKSKWLARAEEEYKQWNKREEFESFMTKTMPHLAKGEIKAIGQSLALKKALHMEKALTKALKFGTDEDQKATAKMVEERKNNPSKKSEPKPKAPDLKSEVHTEVSHITEHYNPKETHGDIIHLKSGHELHGHPKGKFKVGDKVVAKPHIMGTHTLEHKK